LQYIPYLKMPLPAVNVFSNTTRIGFSVVIDTQVSSDSSNYSYCSQAADCSNLRSLIQELK
jgi:hypothetical protein